MLKIVNGNNYFYEVKFYWGGDSKDVESTLDSSRNVAMLSPECIREIEICSTLTLPFFRGHVVYDDMRTNSAVRNMVDVPVVYGQVNLSRVDGSDVPGTDNVPKTVKGDTFTEEVFVTGIDTIDDGKSDTVAMKIHFVSSDYLKFISNLREVTTFDGFDSNTKPLKELLTELFAAAGLGDKLDSGSITMDVDVPYVSSENDTLLTALDYVYRKIFDYDFKNHDGKTYCRMVYDYDDHKYKMWKFDVVGTKTAVDTGLTEPMVKENREVIPIDSRVGSAATGLRGRADLKATGGQSVLFETMDNLKFVDYDYVDNKFETTVKEKNGESFIEHDDEWDNGESTNKNALVMDKYRKYKDNFYERTFTTSRQNGSFYDVFTEAIFGTSFVRVVSDGSIGRKAGNSVLLTFSASKCTMYEHIAGDYLVTAISSKFTNGVGGATFRSTMDLYRPYCSVDSIKEREIL